jgi:hypothetical protein
MINEINDDSIGKIRGPSPISAPDTNQEDAPHVDSGASTIEKSKAVRPEVVPPMNTPILTAPSEQYEIFAVASVDAAGRAVTNTVHSFILKGEEIKESVLEGWKKNLEEIKELVRQMLASPVYQQLQEILHKGDPQSKSVSGVQGVTSANAAAKGEQVELLSALDRWQVLERVPPSAEVPDTSPSTDSSRVLVLPLTAALLAGAGLAIGTEAIQSANPVGGVMEMVERLQPLFPTVSVQDIVPLINLMVVGPIYFNSWNEAISNLRSRDRHNHIPTIHNFAKDVIKIVTDPNFVSGMLVQRMKGTEHLSPTDQDRLARMLKVVLIGVALSLLYSAEVGKVQGGKFGGIEPEELRDLLLGKFSERPDPKAKPTEHEQLTASLIERAWEQLKPLSAEDRTAAVDMLISYVSQDRDFEPMLDPAKVFDEAIDSSKFDPKDKIGMVKA